MIRTKHHALAATWAACAWLVPCAARADSTPESAASAASAAPAASGAAALAPADAASAITLMRVEVTSRAKRLNEARTGIQTQTGASTYTFDADAIAAMPGGDNVQLNQVLLQAPEVAQDSFGQFHVRGEHNGLQYRLNGVILPEGISVFGQSLDPRLISSVTLVTGALPAEYGLRTAGIIDVQTKSGSVEPGGSVSLYGGSHDTVQPSVNYAGGTGDVHYFISADLRQNRLGIESPDGSSDPLHDRTKQTHAFGYVEDILDAGNRVSAALGSSVGAFQIPNQAGLQPSLGLSVNGQTAFPSGNLNENQHEVTQFGFVSLQHSKGSLDWQTSLVGRYSSLNFTPDPIGDLLYNGISQAAYKRDTALALQSDAAWRLDAAHTLRAGVFLQRDNSLSRTTSQVLPTNEETGVAGDMPLTIADDGSKVEWLESVYLQDEWRWRQDWTVNYGVRFDHYSAYSSGQQLSPRLNVVWNATQATTVHVGYSRYFSPPPFELVGGETVSKFANTTAAPAVTEADTPRAERANYFDVGVDQTLAPGFTGGIDTYYKRSRDLIDEGQFGAPIILTPFNYAIGTQEGAELKLNYVERRLSAYANVAFQSAKGTRIDSAQFNFSADDLAYIANHYIDLDHEQKVTASAGVSYLWRGTRLGADALVASGLRADRVLPDGSSIPNGTRLPYYTQVNLGASHTFDAGGPGETTLRLDVINALDRIYEIRNGTGVGVGAPQYGPRRGFFIGVSKAI
jgi:outer membrane receptor protein involved in Fe transport